MRFGGLIVKGTQPQERRCNLCFGIGTLDFIASQLLRQKAIEAFVLVESMNHIVSITPGIGLCAVAFIAIRLCVAHNIKPMSCPSLAVLRARQKTFDDYRMEMERRRALVSRVMQFAVAVVVGGIVIAIYLPIFQMGAVI